MDEGVSEHGETAGKVDRQTVEAALEDINSRSLYPPPPKEDQELYVNVVMEVPELANEIVEDPELLWKSEYFADIHSLAKALSMGEEGPGQDRSARLDSLHRMFLVLGKNEPETDETDPIDRKDVIDAVMKVSGVQTETLEKMQQEITENLGYRIRDVDAQLARLESGQEQASYINRPDKVQGRKDQITKDIETINTVDVTTLVQSD